MSPTTLPMFEAFSRGAASAAALASELGEKASATAREAGEKASEAAPREATHHI